MAKEIERKFLVNTNIWKPDGVAKKMKQAYLTIQSNKVIRVRTSNENAFLTIKGQLNGISRDEYEYEIPFTDALEMFGLCDGKPVEKTRWIMEIEDKTWEIDVFEGENEGLVVAEIELQNESEKFYKPEWLMEEVSTDTCYYNFYLSKHPYKTWSGNR